MFQHLLSMVDIEITAHAKMLGDALYLTACCNSDLLKEVPGALCNGWNHMRLRIFNIDCFRLPKMNDFIFTRQPDLVVCQFSKAKLQFQEC